MAGSNLVGMSLFVFAAADIVHSGAKISDIRTFTYGCGFMNVSGNKGAVGVSLTVGDSPLVFINSHLNSGDKEEDVQVGDM